jgi:uncharacterized protein
MDDLLKLAGALGDNPMTAPLPPVEKWNPEHCGAMDLVIRRDGLWVHEKTPIGRAALVQLFARILRREADDYFLVTPVEKIEIIVEDVPFIITLLEAEGEGERQNIMVQTNLGERFTIGPDHPLEFRDYCPEGAKSPSPAPYVTVRRNLEARFSRNAWYDLASLAKTDKQSGAIGVWSEGVFYPLPV